jgi:class 3 adenylate cyclase
MGSLRATGDADPDPSGVPKAVPKAILFADVKGFGSLGDSDVIEFVHKVWSAISPILVAHHADDVNTWGDGLFCTFATALSAAECALQIRNFFAHYDFESKFRLPAMDVRCGLHFGPVFPLVDPLTNRQSSVGVHVAFGARIEPATTPGQVFASEAFVNTLALHTQGAIVWDKVSDAEQLPKLNDRYPLYRIRYKKTDNPSLPLLPHRTGAGGSLVPAYPRVAASGYSFEALLGRARAELFVAGQNLFSLVRPDTEPRLRDAVLRFLHADPQRRIRILINDATAAHSVQTWAEVQSAGNFAEHLGRATATFTGWVRVAREQGIEESRFGLRVVTHVPVSATFVDPAAADGYAVVAPNTFERKPQVRPVFIVQKLESPEIFEAYWDAYLDQFNNRSREPLPDQGSVTGGTSELS